MTRVSIGLSTCPNDTFAFHALLEGIVNIPGVELVFTLADIEELNALMRSGGLDIAKVSTHAALQQASEVVALPVGWALGHGVGPVVLARANSDRSAEPDRPRVLAPGEHTTATLLWRLFHPEQVLLEQRVFSDIVPALKRGEADLGVCIHEARFTWREQGLHLREDLGETWQRVTDAPLPLGGPVARTSLDSKLRDRVVEGLRASLAWGLAHRADTLPTMRRHAQEEDDAVLMAHVETYVTEWTRELGSEGRRAFDALSGLAHARGLLPGEQHLRVH